MDIFGVYTTTKSHTHRDAPTPSNIPKYHKPIPDIHTTSTLREDGSSNPESYTDWDWEYR